MTGEKEKHNSQGVLHFLLVIIVHFKTIIWFKCLFKFVLNKFTLELLILPLHNNRFKEKMNALVEVPWVLVHIAAAGWQQTTNNNNKVSSGTAGNVTHNLLLINFNCFVIKLNSHRLYFRKRISHSQYYENNYKTHESFGISNDSV